MIEFMVAQTVWPLDSTMYQRFSDTDILRYAIARSCWAIDGVEVMNFLEGRNWKLRYYAYAHPYKNYYVDFDDPQDAVLFRLKFL